MKKRDLLHYLFTLKPIDDNIYCLREQANYEMFLEQVSLHDNYCAQRVGLERVLTI